LPGEVARKVLGAMAGDRAAVGGPAEPLTPREHEALGHLAQGMTNKEIAQDLMISVRTVEAHLRRVHAKLDVGMTWRTCSITRSGGWLGGICLSGDRSMRPGWSSAFGKPLPVIRVVGSSWW
jgi:DNA-binding CsgD family transcriptional regulator